MGKEQREDQCHFPHTTPHHPKLREASFSEVQKRGFLYSMILKVTVAVHLSTVLLFALSHIYRLEPNSNLILKLGHGAGAST